MKKKKNQPIVSVIMGSQSDLKYMKEASDLLKEMKVPFEIQIISAHRSAEKMQSYALEARKRGVQVIIAGAGGAAHLPGMVASLTTLPVVGVPVPTQSMNGLDSLLSIAQMPKGVPVATMAVGGSSNAALMALRILSLSSLSILKKVEAFRKKQKRMVIQSNQRLKNKKI